jgi:hypothetical protein
MQCTSRSLISRIPLIRNVWLYSDTGSPPLLIVIRHFKDAHILNGVYTAYFTDTMEHRACQNKSTQYLGSIPVKTMIKQYQLNLTGLTTRTVE